MSHNHEQWKNVKEVRNRLDKLSHLRQLTQHSPYINIHLSHLTDFSIIGRLVYYRPDINYL